MPNNNVIAQTAESGDYFGSSVATGDFDGDGFLDLAVGAKFENLETAGVTWAGAVNVIYGTSDGLASADDQFWHRDVSGIKGTPEEADLFGFSLAACDFDGDGYDDLAIGAPQNGGPGSVNVLYGSGDGITAADDFWSQNSWGIKGVAENGDFFGSSLAAGFFDAGPYCDLAIGVPIEEVDDVHFAGAVNVIYGSNTGLTASGDQLWHRGNTLGDDIEGDHFGEALTVGDFDGDSFDDLAIGMPYYTIDSGNETLVDAGGVVVLYGSGASGLSAADVQLITQPAGIGDDAGAYNYFSGSWDYYHTPAMTAGDFDGNGADDLAVGSPEDGVFYNGSFGQKAGVVNIIYGTKTIGLVPGNSSQLWHQGLLNSAPEFFDYFGYTLSKGDFNGDHIDDLAIGAAEFLTGAGDVHYAGNVHVLYGIKDEGLSATDVQFWNQGSNQIIGKVEGPDHFGSAIASGDFDYNGADDLAIGVQYESLSAGGNNKDGAVNVIYGYTDDFWVSGLLSLGNQLWHQSSPGINGDGNPVPGVENEAGDLARDELTLEDPATPAQHTFSLAPNFPNPFSDETSLQFTISDEGDATVLLDVFDITGKKVRVLVNAALAAGPHTIQWDGRDDAGQRLAAGVYAFRLQHSEQVLTRMTTLLP